MYTFTLAGSGNLFQCVCQVFYFKQETNCWKIKLAFCKQEHLDVSLHDVCKYCASLSCLFCEQKMKEFYQENSTITDGDYVDVHFQDGATLIEVSTDTADANGWNMNVKERNCQVRKITSVSLVFCINFSQ